MPARFAGAVATAIADGSLTATCGKGVEERTEPRYFVAPRHPSAAQLVHCGLVASTAGGGRNWKGRPTGRHWSTPDFTVAATVALAGQLGRSI